MNLSVTLGDLIVAGTVAATIIGGYHAMKGQLEAFRKIIDSFNGRMDSHAEKLRQHSADIRYTSRHTAALNAKVFGRRVEDRMPGEQHAGAEDNDL